MAKAKKKVSKVKIKKKLWCPVLAPEQFGKKQLGEMYVQSPEKAIGRKLTISLRDLTGSMRDQHMALQLQVGKSEKNNLQTNLIGYEIAATFLKRMIRKNTGRVDANALYVTKDGANVRVKSVLVTRHRCQRSIKTALQHQLHEQLTAEAQKQDAITFVEQVINNNLRGHLKKTLSKIYPLKEVTLRDVSIAR